MRLLQSVCVFQLCAGHLPLSVVQFRCTQLPKLIVAVTLYHITSYHITSLLSSLLCIVFYISSSLCTLLLHMFSILSFCLTSFLSYLPTFLPSSLSSSFPALCLSPYPLLQTLHMPVPCIVVFKSIPIAQQACYSINVCARKDMHCHWVVLLCGKVTDSNC